MSSFFVANFENSGLFSEICASNLKILSLEKLNPDLIKGSLSLNMMKRALKYESEDH